MGAWGEKSFENDSALDWLGGLEAGGVIALRAHLRMVGETDEREYLDLDDGAAAIAAAEIVAAAGGKGRERVPEYVVPWLDRNAKQISKNDLASARLAVERVLGANSELCALWSEGGVATSWHSDVGELLRRLGGSPVSRRRKATREPTPQKVGATESVRHQRWKSALLTFLQMRGLKPDEQQLERIRVSRDESEIRGWLARVVDAKSVAEMLGE